MKRLPTLFLTALLPVVLCLGFSSPAGATPDDCSVDGLQFRFAPSSGLESVHRNGDELELTLMADNDQAASPCGWTGVSISLTLPAAAAADGETSATVPVVSGDSIPAGIKEKTIGVPVPYVVSLPAEVFFAPIEVSFSGTPTLPDEMPEGDPVTRSETAAWLVITRPEVNLTVTPVLDVGSPPFTVDYLYEATNVSSTPGDPPPGPPDGPDPGPAPALLPLVTGPDARDILTDDICGNPQYDSGDLANDSSGNNTGDAWLDPGFGTDPAETWRFNCSHTFERPGIFTNRVAVNGTSSADGRPWPVTVVRSTVTVLGPDLTVEKGHQGRMTVGQRGSYFLTVENRGTTATTASVSVSDLLPAGLKEKAIRGEGWECEIETLTCERSDLLAAGTKWPPVTVDVTPTAQAPDEVINIATVSGGGEVDAASDNNTARDPTAIRNPGKPGPAGQTGFHVRKLKPRRNGAALLRIRIKRPGTLRIDGIRERKRVKTKGKIRVVTRRASNLIRSTRRKVRRPKTLKLIIQPTRFLKRKLKRRQRAGNRRPVRVQLRIGLHQGHGQRFIKRPWANFRRR